MPGGDQKLAFVASSAPSAQRSLSEIKARYDSVPPAEADVIVALGGDGFMLETLHEHHANSKPIFRHASRHRRLPDERLQRRRSA